MILPTALLDQARAEFPDLQIRSKADSVLMRVLAKLLWFNPSFMQFTTTLGSTIYMPDYQSIDQSIIVFLHELVHIADAKRLSKPLFSLLYLFPQVLALLLVPLVWLVSWKLVLPAMALCLLPLPAYWRMRFELRGYIVSLYVRWQLAKKRGIIVDLTEDVVRHTAKFHSGAYYFMWWSKDVDKKLQDAATTIIAGGKPFEDPVFDIVDRLLTLGFTN